MLSEFEVPKPKNEFNQIFLDNQDVYIESIKVTMKIFDNLYLPGQLHLTTRSLVFEPKHDRNPLIKLRYCDGVTMKTSKLSPDHFIRESINQYHKFQKAINRSLQIDNEDILTKYNYRNNQVNLFVKSNKFIIYERNPPAPFSVEFIKSFFIFIVEELSTDKDSLYVQDNKQEGMYQSVKNFENIFKQAKFAEEEENFINELFQQKYQLFKSRIKEKTKIEFIYPCKIIQTFEYFYGLIYLTSKNKVIIRSILNQTKKIKVKFSINDLKWITQYQYFYKNSAVELFLFSQSISFLLNFDTVKRAEKVYKKFKQIAYELIDVQLDVITKTWSQNLMTNFDYLMYLNRLSNRSFNDITRYPIFPWVISDYSNEELKINNKYQYREFEKPVGTINEASKRKAEEFFSYLKSDPIPSQKPYHFYQYISNPGYIIFFYTRHIPSLILKLQSGAFGPNERIFKSFENLWNSMHCGETQFVELIPEFYSLNKTHILLNKYKLDFGVNSQGDYIRDVEIPRWANNIEDFMFKMKTALESEHTSLNLHLWIDLIFGVCQKGEEAEKRVNIFNESCYKENFDFINSKNKVKLQSLNLQIQEYGQIPLQLFNFFHPKKKIKAQIVMNQYPSQEFLRKNSIQNQSNENQEEIEEGEQYQNGNFDIDDYGEEDQEEYESEDDDFLTDN